MAEQDHLKNLDEVLDNLKDLSAKSKEYYKFIIGLATGTLVFSVTFLREFGTFPEYKVILITGWLCLLVSIIAGVLILPMRDQLQVRIQSLKALLRSPELLAPIFKKELQQHYLKTLIKIIIDPVFKDDEKGKEELYQRLNKFSTKELEKFLEGAGLMGVKDSKGIRLLKEFFEEIIKFLSLAKMVERETNITFVFRSFRKIHLQTIWFDRVMRYAFFVGIFAISFFSIINFL